MPSLLTYSQRKNYYILWMKTSYRRVGNGSEIEKPWPVWTIRVPYGNAAVKELWNGDTDRRGDRPSKAGHSQQQKE